ncbi:alpha/beta hydrolase family protein [Pseudomonas poae]|uniref:Dienelactone hydrolase n=1 Tax=Pseudomonas poae TaxID=200451 RepID=A0A2S9F022_9PSED|nr:alpha/beta fold hydrolase [Pseudomonas poae]PRA31469.1 dienelactone hydrolase [Pseudomonas poae]PRC23075.1 dienelactone hydrolase [Pseudomonas poae]
MRTTLAALCLIFLATPAFADNSVIGFHNTTLPDPQNNRALQMVVWYPANTSATPELIRDDAVFYGALAVPDAPPASGEHPLVVISHGNGGNWGNQLWLASALAHRGYIVAAVNHPGTTSKDRNPETAAQLWQRPKDLSRVIDAVLAQPKQFGAVANGKIAAVGHSLGGWTVLEIGGARFDPDLFTRDCKAHPQLSGCTAYQKVNTASTAASKAEVAADLRDKRITAVVSLDLGLSRGMTDASLAAMPVPVLVLAAGVAAPELPAELESADLARRLPKASTQYLKINDATHFSFMAICKPTGEALIEEHSPGDGMICHDGKGARPREVIQQQVVALITDFLG